MKKIFTVFCLSGLALTSMAQMRYIDKVFTSVNVTTDVKFAENYSVLTGSPVISDLIMDVYEPKNDTVAQRPVIVMAHAGSFLPKCTYNTLPLGDRKDSSVVEMCKQFAKRGYVAVAMDYRLGWNPTSTDADVRAGTIMQAVYRGLQDMKACVRYMKLNAGVYGIDTNKVVIAGSNSGGYMALAYGALNDSSEVELLKFKHSVTGNPYIDMNMIGDWDGRGGNAALNKYENPGVSSDAHLILNLGGAMADTSWQEAGEAPIISFHGEQDALTPYKTAVVIVAATGQPVVEVSGSHDLSRYATALGNQAFNDDFLTDAYSVEAAARTPHKGLYPFPGAANGYEPWSWYDAASPCADNTTPGATGTGSKANPFATKAKALLYIDTIMGYFCPRALNVLRLPGNTVGIANHNQFDKTISVYPNPASDVITVNSDYDVINAAIYDLNGKTIWSNLNQKNRNFKIDVSNLNNGFYFLRIETDHGIAVKKISVN